MRRIFAGRFCAVMAAYAVAGDVDVIEVRGQPADGAVTIVTGVTTGNMRQVFAYRDDAIMAGAASPDNLRVVNRHYGCENIGRVAVLAHIGRLNVRHILARRVGAVVTANAIARDVDVIEVRRQPGDGTVTVIAIVAAGYVRRILASRRDAIVTTATVSDDLGVIDREHRHEYGGRMTVFTNIRRLHVRRVLAGGKRAVVTANAIAGIRRVIECRWQPACCRMTVIAGVAAGDMQRMFADRGDPIVAESTTAQDLGVIDRQHRCKQRRRMAVLANIGCLHMGRVLADGVRTVVTAYAVSCDVGVIEIGCRNPGGSDVTIVAGVPCRYVRRVLADRHDSVVT